MNITSGEPDPVVVRKTFLAEAVRAVAAGIQETAFATFAILIAVKHFSSGPVVKATLISSLALGLLGGLFILPLIARMRWSVSRAASGVQLLSMAGFLAAAFFPGSESAYLVGMFIGMGIISMAIPLQTHYLQENFPNSRRGRLFSASILIRAFSAMIFSWLIGSYLDADMSRFSRVILLFAVASGLAAVCQFLIPSQPFADEVKKHPVRNSIHFLQNDRIFARLIAAAMAMGIGVLSANALRVDYLVNPDHGLHFDAKTAALITGVIPSISRIVSTFFWGWLFDQMNFFKLRAIVTLFFLGGILFYFLTGNLAVIMMGSAILGLARGGGEILWNLWVTKLANPSQIAGYMSVHTFMTGLRMAAAPFIGFFVVKLFHLPIMIAFSTFFILLSLVILRPLIFPAKAERPVSL